ncbi:MAG: hypothetical protein WDM87_13380 [Terracidiphilus sp.]
MESVLESSAHLERELTREPFAGPAAGSMGLHLAIFGMLICYGWAMGLFHHNFWGTPGSGGSMQGDADEHDPAAGRPGEPECAGDGDAEQGACRPEP